MRRSLAPLLALAVLVPLVPFQQVASAAPAAPAPTTTVARPPAPNRPADPDRVLDPDRRLGTTWRRSADRVVTTSSDETGLHVLVADAKEAYRWRTAAHAR